MLWCEWWLCVDGEIGHAGGVVGEMCDVSVLMVFFFQAEDGIRDAQESRGLGDVYKRQVYVHALVGQVVGQTDIGIGHQQAVQGGRVGVALDLSLIHI